MIPRAERLAVHFIVADPCRTKSPSFAVAILSMGLCLSERRIVSLSEELRPKGVAVGQSCREWINRSLGSLLSKGSKSGYIVL